MFSEQSFYFNFLGYFKGLIKYSSIYLLGYFRCMGWNVGFPEVNKILLDFCDAIINNLFQNSLFSLNMKI